MIITVCNMAFGEQIFLCDQDDRLVVDCGSKNNPLLAYGCLKKLYNLIIVVKF